jgi:hypothetical protein
MLQMRSPYHYLQCTVLLTFPPQGCVADLSMLPVWIVCSLAPCHANGRMNGTGNGCAALKTIGIESNWSVMPARFVVVLQATEEDAEMIQCGNRTAGCALNHNDGTCMNDAVR